MESFSRPELFDFKGVSMSSLFTSNWENVQNFQARSDDILIATYPKAGRLHQELPISLTNCALVRPPIRLRVRVRGGGTNAMLPSDQPSGCLQTLHDVNIARF